MLALAPITAETAPRPQGRPDPAPARADDRVADALVSRVEPSGKAHQATVDTAAAKPAPSQRGSSARLSYDHEDKRVYVEIIDPQTGDVLQRLPPDIIAKSKSIDGTQPGAIFDRTV